MKKGLTPAAFFASLIGLIFAVFVLINNGNILVQIPRPEGPRAIFLAFRISSGVTISIIFLSLLLLLLAIVLKRRAHS